MTDTSTTQPDPTNRAIGEYIFSHLAEPEVDKGGIPVGYWLTVQYADGQEIRYEFVRPVGGKVVALTAINYEPPIDPSILAEKQS